MPISGKPGKTYSIDEVMNMYQIYQDGNPLCDVGKYWNLSRQRIHQIFKQHGFSCRDRFAPNNKIKRQVIPTIDYQPQSSRGEVDLISISQREAYVIVDDIDSDLNQYNWWEVNGYAIGRSNCRLTPMHRIILARMLGRPLEPHEEVDHKNLNRLDNRRSNLRVATHQQNMWNRQRNRNNKTGLKGVSWSNKDKAYRAVIKQDGKTIFLGSFKDPKKAHAAYCDFALKARGEFARFE